jgi:hypothetical protein
LLYGRRFYQRGLGPVIDFAEPRLAPKYRAPFLAAAVVGTRAAQVQKYNVICPKFSQEHESLHARGTDFNHSSRDPKPAPTVLEHFRHERQMIERSCIIEGLGDFMRTFYFD